MKKNVTFFKKIGLILISIIIILCILYFGQAVIFVNSAKLDLNKLKNNSYMSEKNDYQLRFEGDKTLTLTCPEKTFSKNIETYNLKIETKGNVIMAKDEEKKFVFIPVSEDRIYFQTRNVLLFNVEYVKLLQEQQQNEKTQA